ncbi:MAG: hypothetical protein V4625_12775 [Pseudomonadota bacterium]
MIFEEIFQKWSHAESGKQNLPASDTEPAESSHLSDADTEECLSVFDAEADLDNCTPALDVNGLTALMKINGLSAQVHALLLQRIAKAEELTLQQALVRQPKQSEPNP